MEAWSACLPAGRDSPDVSGTSCSARSGYRKLRALARGVSFNGKKLRGLCYIGIKPTFKARKQAQAEKTRNATHIETYIFNFKKNIYGMDLEIQFIKKIRDEKRFGDKNKLATRIRRDMAIAKRYFAKAHS